MSNRPLHEIHAADLSPPRHCFASAMAEVACRGPAGHRFPKAADSRPTYADRRQVMFPRPPRLVCCIRAKIAPRLAGAYFGNLAGRDTVDDRPVYHRMLFVGRTEIALGMVCNHSHR